jgi:iron complex outermembrane recepter protein
LKQRYSHLIRNIVMNSMKRTIVFFFFLFFTLTSWTQNITISGTVTDEETGQPIVGATVFVKETGQGTISDFDGKFTVDVKPQSLTVAISFVGYQTYETKIDGTANVVLDAKIASSLALKEILVTADIAVDRKTPVAVSSISTQRFREELASQDLPMLLNSTPGVYATQGGGGDGDARITIRGFNQRNVAVMLDGIPVNDMENGSVFWSNWFGLGLVTKKMEVQRGLGASKISIPSVGGTINIITKGIESKAGFDLKQEYGRGDYLQTTLGFTTGRLKSGFGITGAMAYRNNKGIIEGLYSKAYFYFLRIDKEIGKHLFSLTGFGAPQEHGQRGFQEVIQSTNSDFAAKIGVPQSLIDATQIKNKGIYYNDNLTNGTDTSFNARFNYYHKPQFSFKHSWNASKNTFLSTVAYLSIGNGGGTDYDPTSVPVDGNTGRVDINTVIATNKRPLTSNPTILRANINNHFWYGLLSTLQHNIGKNHAFKAGIDGRYYRGEHYRTVHDLLGGKQYYGYQNARTNNRTTPLSAGDKYFYNYDGFVRWLGGFGLYEFSGSNWNAFVNVSGAMSSYKLEDFMYAKRIKVNGRDTFTSYATTINEVPLRVALDKTNKVMYTVENVSSAMYNYANLNGYKIDSTSAQNQVLGWVNLPSFTFKTGFNYIFDKHHNAFINTGYLSRATRFNNVFYTRGIARGNSANNIFEYTQFKNYDNEEILAIEGGYQFRSSIFSANFNTYYTIWKNKPVDNPVTALVNPLDPQSERVALDISGLGARHYGFELDFAMSVMPKLKMEGLASYGDWIWNSKGTQSNPASGEVTEFDPRGVKIGDAAQLQLGGMVRYEPFKKSYLSFRGTFFGNNYSNFNPETLTDINVQRQSWKMPNYFVGDFNMGYNMKLNKVNVDWRFNLLNVFDTLYISDASNNGIGSNLSNFDASSATVFFGLPRRWTVSAEISF